MIDGWQREAVIMLAEGSSDDGWQREAVMMAGRGKQ